MPGKIKSGAQFRFMEMMAHSGKKKKKGAGPSPSVAQKMLDDEGHTNRSKLAKMK